MKSIKEQFKTITTITRYSIKMFFRDRAAIYFSLFIPLLIMLIFGVLNFGSAKPEVGIVDLAKNPMSVQMIDGLKKANVLQIEEGSQEEKLDKLKRSDLDLVLVLPENFGANLGQQRTTAIRQPASQSVQVYYDQAENNTSVNIGLTVIKQAFDQFTHQAASVPELFIIEEKTVAVRDLSYIDFIIPGVAAMSVMQMSIFGVVGAIVSWRERGILKRLLATPIKSSNIIFAQVVTRIIITLLQVSVLIGVGLFFFDLNLAGSLLLFFFLAFLGGLIFLSMGFAMSGVATTQNTVMAVANLIMMPQMFLSGVFFPREALPEYLKIITGYFPLTYLSSGMREVMIQGASAWEVRGDIVGLVVWAILMFFLASRMFRWE